MYKYMHNNSVFTSFETIKSNVLIVNQGLVEIWSLTWKYLEETYASLST